MSLFTIINWKISIYNEVKNLGKEINAGIHKNPEGLYFTLRKNGKIFFKI